MRQAFLLILTVGLTFSLQGCRVEDVQELVAFFQGESPADYTQEKAIPRAYAALVEYTRQEHLDIKAFKGPYLEVGVVSSKDPLFPVYTVYYFSPTHYFSYHDYSGLEDRGINAPGFSSKKWLDDLERHNRYYEALIEKTP